MTLDRLIELFTQVRDDNHGDIVVKVMGDIDLDPHKHKVENGVLFLNLKSEDKWELYQDEKKEWRWKRKARNGENVGASHEGYKNRIDCLANAKRHGYTGA